MKSFRYETDVPVPMRDGVALATNVWRPDGGEPGPALLVRLPYGKDSTLLVTAGIMPNLLALLDAGYAVVAQDCRGTGRSPGRIDPFAQEPADGADTVAWIAAQPWCDGNVGMFGASYLGIAQWAAAAEGTPALRAIAPAFASGDLYRAPFYSTGGAASLGQLTATGLLFAAYEARRAGEPAPELGAYLADQRPLALRLPTGDRPEITKRLPWFETCLAHPDRDAYWASQPIADGYERVSTPALSIGGWYDPLIGGTIAGYVAMRHRGATAAARDGQRLLIGPWNHFANTDVDHQDRDFGAAGGSLAADVTGAHVRFFDRWLRGREVPEEPRVRIFVMGVDRWRDEPDWPLPGTRYVEHHLHRDGALRPDTAPADGTDTFRYDPRDPVPTVSGSSGPNRTNRTGPVDQRAVERRPDVLCWTGPELTRPVEVTGHVTLTVFVSTSVRDTDITGKLVDVHPDGAAINLCDGILRARYRNGLDRPELLTPGQVYELQVDLGVTSNAFLPGHRIRLEVSSSNVPRYDRNTNTGGVIARDGESDVVVARTSVHHGPARPSRLTLPVVDRPLGSPTGT